MIDRLLFEKFSEKIIPFLQADMFMNYEELNDLWNEYKQTNINKEIKTDKNQDYIILANLLTIQWGCMAFGVSDSEVTPL